MQSSMQTCRRAAVSGTRLASNRTTKTHLSQSRHFMTNPLSSTPQTLTATRTVPFPASAVYAVVADISSYSQFLPFCRSSIVTKHSSPDTHPQPAAPDSTTGSRPPCAQSSSRVWPEEAELTIGYNDDVSETFHSRVYCVPERIVEAVSGDATTTLGGAEIKHHSPRRTGDAASRSSVLTHLLTRWSLRAFPYKPPPVDASPQEGNAVLEAEDRTEVRLFVEYRFSNPLYATLTAAAAPKVAEYMMEAFEKRVKSLVDGQAAADSASVKDGDSAREGVIRPRHESP